MKGGGGCPRIALKEHLWGALLDDADGFVFQHQCGAQLVSQCIAATVQPGGQRVRVRTLPSVQAERSGCVALESA